MKLQISTFKQCLRTPTPNGVYANERKKMGDIDDIEFEEEGNSYFHEGGKHSYIDNALRDCKRAEDVLDLHWKQGSKLNASELARIVLRLGISFPL